MQKQLYFLCGALLVAGLAGAQTGAEYIFDMAGEGRPDSASALLADTLSGDVLVAAVAQCESSLYNCAVIQRVSPSGDTRWMLNLGGPQEAYRLVALQRSDPASYLAAGVVQSSVNFTTAPVLLRLDAATGDTIWQRTYAHPRYERFVDMTQAPDGSIYLLSAGKDLQGISRMGLLKTTVQGDTLWWRGFDFTHLINTGLYEPQNITWATDTSLVLCVQISRNTGSPVDYWESAYLLIDTMGQSLIESSGVPFLSLVGMRYEQTYSRASVMYPNPLVDHFYVAGTQTLSGLIVSPDSNYHHLVSSVRRRARQGGEPWVYNILRSTPHEIQDAWLAANGDLLVSGQREDEMGERYGWLFRISPTGELVWERSYRSIAPHHCHLGFSKLAEATNGRLWVMGSLVSPAEGDDFTGFNPNTRLVSLDADGCFTPGCAQEYVVLTPVRKPTAPALRTAWLRAWPNPAPDVLHVELLHVPPPGARLRLFNWQGQEVSRTVLKDSVSVLTIDLAPLSAGLYLLSLEAGGRVLHTEKIVRG